MQPVRTVTTANKESGVFFMSLISTKDEKVWIQIKTLTNGDGRVKVSVTDNGLIDEPRLKPGALGLNRSGSQVYPRSEPGPRTLVASVALGGPGR
jgi:hypothetical protein